MDHLPPIVTNLISDGLWALILIILRWLHLRRRRRIKI